MTILIKGDAEKSAIIQALHLIIAQLETANSNEDLYAISGGEFVDGALSMVINDHKLNGQW